MAAYRILTSYSSWSILRRPLYLQVSQFSSTIKYQDIEIILNENPKPKPLSESIVFGKHFTDHMFLCNWDKENGWSSPKILPYGDLRLSPAATALQSGIECFEGLKVYNGVDGKIRLFRPLDYLKRLQASASMLSLPKFHEGDFLECIKELIRIDKGWVPKARNSFLYVRTAFIGIEPSLNDSIASSKALLYCIACPVEPEMKPISVYADPRFTQPTASGLCRPHNIGGNYPPVIKTQSLVQSKECDSILWLGEINEITTVDSMMNIFVHWINDRGDSEIVTPSLTNGLVFPGVTRSSLIDLANCWSGYTVNEQNINMTDIKKAINKKRIKEMFATGAIGVLNPIVKILHVEESIPIPTMAGDSKVIERCLKELADIQCGVIDHPWSVIVE